MLPDTSYTFPANLGRTLSRGCEVSVQYSPLAWLGVTANYSYNRTVVDTAGTIVLPYHPQNVANGSLTVNDLRLADKLWWGWKFNANYTDCQNPGPYYDAVLPRTVVCGQTVSLKIWNARIYWRIDNLFDANYQTRYGYPMPRRNYAIGVSMEMWE
jgi:outer membrane cobalamin receptor